MSVIIDGVTYVPAPEQPAPATMTEVEAGFLAAIIDRKGFSYAFTDYSDFERIEHSRVNDQRFHQLRRAYVLAHAELQAYLVMQGAYPQ